MNIMKKIVLCFSAVFLFFTAGNFNYYSAATLQEETTDLDIGKSAEETDVKNQYDITFTLPTKVRIEPETVDIVFVLDTTTISSFATVKQDFNEFVDKLNASEHLIVNVGIVTFNLNATDKLSGLMELNDTNIDTIKNGFASNATAGSNMYGGLLIGKNILDTGTADKKYLVMASDFGGYKSDAGDGAGLSNFHKDGTIIGSYHNNSDFNGKYYYTQSAGTEADVFTVDAVDNLINTKQLFSGVYATGDTEPYLTQTGAVVGEYPDLWRYTLLHTFTEEEKSTMPTYNFTTQTTWPTMFEKNIYLSGNLFQEMNADGYNIFAVTTPYQPQTGAEGEGYKYKFNYASNAFKDWFELNIGTRYETTDNESFSDMLDDIEKELVYLLGKGVIEDTVNPDFAVVENGTPRVYLNDVLLTETVLPNGDIAFGDAENGVYPYEYQFYTENGVEKVKWVLNKEAKKDDVLRFVFTVKLKSLPTNFGTYYYETNTEAKIDYMDSKEALLGNDVYTKVQYMESPVIEVTMSGVIAIYKDTLGNEIDTRETFVLQPGESYTTTQKEIVGYTFKQMDASSALTSGTVTDGVQEVIYVYEKNPDPTSQVIVRYIDENAVELAASETITGVVGANYQTVQKEIAGYTFKQMDALSAPASGTITTNVQEVIYVYEKKPDPTSQVIVRYVDVDGIEIATTEYITGVVGDNYQTVKKNITGYTFKEMHAMSDPVSGTITEETQEVIYVYEKVAELPATGIVNVPQIISGMLLLFGGMLIFLNANIKRKRDGK